MIGLKYYKIEESEINLTKIPLTTKILFCINGLTKGKNEQFLQKVLDARKFDTPDDHISIFESKEPVIFRKLKKNLPQLEAVISLGWSYENWQLQVDPQIRHLINITSTYFLLGPAVEQLQKDQKLKLHFWEEINKIQL